MPNVVLEGASIPGSTALAVQLLSRVFLKKGDCGCQLPSRPASPPMRDDHDEIIDADRAILCNVAGAIGRAWAWADAPRRDHRHQVIDANHAVVIDIACAAAIDPARD